MISPIITMDLVIGVYFIARANDITFSEKEIAWFEQIVIYVGQTFENSKKQFFFHAIYGSPQKYVPIEFLTVTISISGMLF
jgi:hypothetical protein